MDKKSKILIKVILILIALSICFTFYRTVISKDYPIIESSDAAAN